jgi:tetratricopeptide (TPR) repeat protein
MGDNLDRGIALLRDSLAKRPDDPKICIDLMTASCRKESSHEAATAFVTFVKHTPNATQLHHDMLVEVSRRRGFAGPLHKAFQQAAKNPSGAEAFLVQYAFGLLYTALGMHNEAIPFLSESVRLNPGYGPAHHNLGLALHYSSDTLGDADGRRQRQKAIEECKKATVTSPPCAEAHYFLGVMEMADGDPIRALLHFREFVGLAKPYLAGYVPQAQISIQLLKEKLQA